MKQLRKWQLFWSAFIGLGAYWGAAMMFIDNWSEMGHGAIIAITTKVTVGRCIFPRFHLVWHRLITCKWSN